MDRNVPYWFAVHTRSRHEKQVDSFLKEKCIDSFLPLIKTLSRRRDRRAFVDLPLFPGYLFVNIPLDNVFNVITIRGVVRIIGTDHFTPTPIPEKQVNDIKMKSKGNKVTRSIEVGKLIAKEAAEKKIETVVFDRGGNIFHGRIKAVADGARAGGLKF